MNMLKKIEVWGWNTVYHTQYKDQSLQYDSYREEDWESDFTELWENVDLQCTSHSTQGLYGHTSVGNVLFLAALWEECRCDGVRGGEGGGVASYEGGQLHVSTDLSQCLQQSLLNKDENVKEA